MGLMYEFKELKLIFKTLGIVTVPMFNLMGSLGIVYYIFALVGMKRFGGLVNKDSYNNMSGIPAIYMANNFNDLISSFVTLFSIMVVNNWFVTVNMYVQAC